MIWPGLLLATILAVSMFPQVAVLSSMFELPWGNIMAASVVVTMPVVALVLLFQRRIVADLTAETIDRTRAGQIGSELNPVIAI